MQVTLSALTLASQVPPWVHTNFQAARLNKEDDRLSPILNNKGKNDECIFTQAMAAGTEPV